METFTHETSSYIIAYNQQETLRLVHDPEDSADPTVTLEARHRDALGEIGWTNCTTVFLWQETNRTANICNIFLNKIKEDAKNYSELVEACAILLKATNDDEEHVALCKIEAIVAKLTNGEKQ